MHGGIPAENFHLDSVNKISSELRCELATVADPIDDIELLIQGFLWSDPTTDDGLYFSDRGAGYHFGNDISRNFLRTHDLKYIIRAHEPFESGSNHQDVGDEGRAVVTVFSTANYPCGQGSNMGAVLHLDESTKEYQTVQFKFDAGPQQDGSSAYESMLRPFIDDNKSKLTRAFRKTQNDDNGFVTVQEWAHVVETTLELPDLPWLELQPELAPIVEGDFIDWWAFLDNAGTPIPHLERLKEEDLSLLHQHKDKFLNIFQVLDTDRNGTISKEEFVTGIETLNGEIPDGEKKMHNAAELFHVFDIDADQQISIDEFVDAITSHSTLKGVTDSLDPEQVEALHSNHEMLLTAFKYLDSDHSGTIDPDEFQVGIDALNKRLPERQKINDAAELFELLDSDGNGVIGKKMDDRGKLFTADRFPH
jgi:Ca2+-binding EF-hand superfamily protein/diadenosine tetraphosphatase ApaH/serine/threonine PP2A family protein phosphatase